MPHHPPPLAATTLAIAAALTLAACGDATPAPAPTQTATPTPAATTAGVSAATLRAVDWASAPVLDELRRHFNGGEVEPKRVAYADLTRDGHEDALVIVESGGTAGDLGAAVYTIRDARAVPIAWIDRPGHIELRLPDAGPPNAGPASSLIVVQQGIYAPGDANCCPSRIREIALRWDGAAFQIFSDQTLPAPR